MRIKIKILTFFSQTDDNDLKLGTLINFLRVIKKEKKLGPQLSFYQLPLHCNAQIYGF